MSRTAQADRCLTSEEQRLLRHYIREGGTEDKLAKAARKTKITLERAQALLKRVHVGEELARRRHLLEYEQAKLDAADLNRRETKEDEQIDLTEKKIFQQMIRLIETPAEEMKDGHQMKAQFLKLAAVFTGTIRDGRLEKIERMSQPDGTLGVPEPCIYQSIYTRAASQVQQEPADLLPDEAAPAAAAKTSPLARPAAHVAAKTPDDARASAHAAKAVLEVPVPAAAARR
jgi:hypothetical protein